MRHGRVFASGSGISFVSFDQIKTTHFGELGRAWSENREPRFRFSPRSVLTRDPDEWNGRFYIAVGLNPFVSAEELRRIRADTHAYVASLFWTVWSKEKHSFTYWYDLELRGYQGILHKAVLQSRQDRLRAVSEFRPAEPIFQGNLNAILTSFAENMVHSLRWIFLFPRDGSELSSEQIARLEKSFGEANRIADALFVRLPRPDGCFHRYEGGQRATGASKPGDNRHRYGFSPALILRRDVRR